MAAAASSSPLKQLKQCHLYISTSTAVKDFNKLSCHLKTKSWEDATSNLKTSLTDRMRQVSARICIKKFCTRGHLHWCTLVVHPMLWNLTKLLPCCRPSLGHLLVTHYKKRSHVKFAMLGGYTRAAGYQCTVENPVLRDLIKKNKKVPQSAWILWEGGLGEIRWGRFKKNLSLFGFCYIFTWNLSLIVVFICQFLLQPSFFTWITNHLLLQNWFTSSYLTA